MISAAVSLAPIGLAVAGFVAVSAAPALGAAPTGPAHGGDERSIAAALGPQLASDLRTHPHAIALLSEQDLTVLVRRHNPAPALLRDPVARIRDGKVVVSGVETIFGRDLTAVAFINVTVVDDAAGRHMQATVDHLELGRVRVPDWAESRVIPRSASTVNVSALFGANAYLKALTDSLDCVVPGGGGSTGLMLGVHRPGIVATPGACA